jgi:hypothetical protein
VIPADLRRDSEGRDDTSGNEGQPILEACAVEALSLRRIPWGLLGVGLAVSNFPVGFVARCTAVRCSLAKRCPFSYSQDVGDPAYYFSTEVVASPEGQPLKIALRQRRDSQIFHYQFAREPAGILMLTVQTPLPSIGSAMRLTAVTSNRQNFSWHQFLANFIAGQARARRSSARVGIRGTAH